MDSLEEKGAGSMDRGSGGEERRCCADCRTTKTPLWRGGPSGPKSLCNACGIRYRKRRRETARSKEGERRGEGEGIGVSLKLRVLEDRDGVVVEPRSTMAEATKKRMMGMMGEEEERAAVLLMALSFGVPLCLNIRADERRHHDDDDDDDDDGRG